MTSQPIATAIEAARQDTIQSRIDQPVTGGNVFVVNWIAKSGATVSPWWSQTRDMQLRDFWKSSDHIAGTVYTLQAKLTAIPFRIEARDRSVQEHVRQAEDLTEVMFAAAEFGEGWPSFYGRWCEDLVTQDNGAFGEIIGPGDPAGPLTGMPISIAHLDSLRCLGRDSRLTLPDGSTRSIYRIVKERYNGKVLSIDSNGRKCFRQVTGWYESPLQNRYWLRIKLKDAKRAYGRSEGLWVTNDHEVMTRQGWKRADQLTLSDEIMTPYVQPSPEQQHLLIGTLLGDACLTKPAGQLCKSGLGFTQGIDQEQWLATKMYALLGLGWSNIRHNDRTLQTSTKTSPYLTVLRSEWYPEGKKIVPRELIGDALSDMTLATWYMDDGDLQKHTWNERVTGYSPRLSTLGFSPDDSGYLKDILTRQGITASLHRMRDSYGIYITASGGKMLFQKIGRFVIPSMRYKLPPDTPDFEPKSWQISETDPYYSPIESIERGNNGQQATAYCIDVEDTHSFIAGGMLVHNCTRTGNAEYPVIYEDLSGTRYKMHYTRVLYSSQMPSPIADMFGVGFCSVSRCINVAQTLVDMLTFKQEKMGSRPHRKILVTKGGLDPKDLQRAFTLAETEMDNQGLTRYSKIVTVGSGTLMESGIDEIDLSTLPDGFDENTSTILGMATIALAFGMDARELFPALGAGSTRAEALLQHLKQRGKGPGQIIQITENLFNHKYLPPHLRMVFDFQDDAQDRQVADSRKVRAEKRQIDSQTGALDKRAMREQMLADGDIDRGQFERLELRDGRLADGSSILSLFYSDDRQISKMLDLGVDDPLDVSGNTPTPKPVIQDFEVQQPFVKAAGDPPKPNGKPTPPPLRKVPTKPEPAQVGVEAEEPPILEKIRDKLEENNKILITARTERTRWSATQAIAALSYLEQAYTQHNSSPLSILGGNNDLMPSGKSQASREQRRLNSGAPTGQDTAQRENLNQDSDETDLIE